jgi:type I site-specific restriction endonuclease
VTKRGPGGDDESEWQTPKRRIDPLLDAAGWPLRKSRTGAAFRTEEEETANGPADYALWLDNRIIGIVEAKKLTIGPQYVLTQAERYARGLDVGNGVEALFSSADALEERLAAASRLGEKLPQAILAKAFRGELVKQAAETRAKVG